jgi:DNA-binding CsgD family transcriptional regulator
MARLKTTAAMEAVYALWDDLDQFPPDRSDAALAQLCQRLKDLLKADNVKWVAAVRMLKDETFASDSMRGWRLRAKYDLVPDGEAYEKLIRVMFERNDPADSNFNVGHATVGIIKRMGKFQAHRMRDGWIPYEEFAATEHYQIHYTGLGITDRIWTSFPLNADAESVFMIDRMGPAPQFSLAEVKLAATILRGIRSFHRRLFMDRALLIGDKPLSPVARRVLQKLLTGISEKQIAESLGQTVTTTHKYVKTIYGRFGVNGRAALMSLCLRN